MPLLALDESRATFDHVCDAAGRPCGHVRRGLRLAPGPRHATTGICGPACFAPDGQPHAHHGDLLVTEGAFITRPCPLCGSVEAFFRTHLPHDAGESAQPGTLVGTRYPEIGPAGSIVLEHSIGGHTHPYRQLQCALIRRLQRHPAMAPHAPLHEAVLLGQALSALAVKLQATASVQTPVQVSAPAAS